MAQQKSNKGKKNQAAEKKSTWKKKFIIFFLKVFGIGVSISFLMVLFTYLGLFGQLPNYTELKNIKNHSASEIFSADGELMGKFFIENRLSIGNNQMSNHLKNALIATEDSRFFEHSGIDVVSLGRVIMRTVLMGDLRQGGGSTISQQLAKNLYPRKSHFVLSLVISKIKELFIAHRLEEIYSKDDILTLYLNTVPFGEDIYGIEVAAQRFFHKKSAWLNPSESATLIGMLAANTAYNPRLNPKRSMKRRNVVLSRMESQGFITVAESKSYKDKPISLNYRKIDHNGGVAPYFRAKLKKTIQSILEEKYGDEYDLFRDGLKIYTSIDSRLQSYASKAVNNHLIKLQKEFNAHWKGREPWKGNESVYTNELRESTYYRNLKASGLSDAQILEKMSVGHKMNIYDLGVEKEVTMSSNDSVKHSLKTLHAGFLAVNPQNGHILAWVGGVNHKYFPYDHVTAERQVGSTFKPIVYASALMDGFKPCDFYSNERKVYSSYNDWSPTNSDGEHSGFYSMKGALANSVNTVTADLAINTGIRNVIHMAENLGIEKDIPEVASISLGAATLSLLDMIEAYSGFANYGVPMEPVGLLKIEDRSGKVLYEYEPMKEPRNVLDEEVAHTMIQLMKGVVERGTARSLRSVYGLKSDLCGKTGTTQDNADGWFIGFTPTLVAGCWVGADNPAIHFRTTALGQGAHMALPVFANFLRSVEANPQMYNYTQQCFYGVPEYLAASLECEDFVLENPNQTFWERLFDGKKEPDSNTMHKSSDDDDQKEHQKKRKQSLLQKMKKLFGGSN